MLYNDSTLTRVSPAHFAAVPTTSRRHTRRKVVRHRPLFLVIALLLLSALACDLSFSTANISEATLARDAAGAEPTTVFNQDDVFYLLVDLVNAPDDTTVRAAWTAVEVEGEEPDLFIDETELTTGDGRITFDLSNDSLWPVGTYKVDLYLNDELDRTLEFQVQ